MGMDYRYAGSASYPRFDTELCAIAEVFGGIKTEHLKEREQNIGDENTLSFWFGFLSSDDTNEPKFIFPEDTNKTLVKWFNNIYGDFTKEETEIIWECVSKHPEIQDLSHDIWYELEHLVENEESWSIW